MAPKPLQRVVPHLRAVQYHNLHTLLSQPLAELSGSLGDLGTLLPLMIALTLTGSISLPSTLLFTGAANIYSGVAFGIPIPVQPMKAVAAVAIARRFSLEETAASGIVVAALVGVMSVTGLVRWASNVTPIPVVKGIQVGAGLSLCLSAGSSLLNPLSWTGPWWGDNLLWALLAVILLLATLPFPRAPYALAVFVLGLILAGFHAPSASPPDHSTPHSNSSSNPFADIPILHPSAATFWHATTTAALGQLPLTLLNSVIAASALAIDLFPSPPYPTAPSVTSLGLSVSLINLIGCWFGAMPACHGSGGLAAQYRFGARSGASIILLGLLKVTLGVITLWKAEAVVSILKGFPAALLGVLVLAAGVELAKVGESLNTDARDLRVMHGDEDGEETWDGKGVRSLDERERRERWMVLLVTVAALLAFRNDGIGFLVGLAWHWGFRATKRVEDWRARRQRRETVPEEERGLLS
ncbi:uncharacterized protein BDZ99DRAFT_461158 [Mytilinidion resinicola]|uniref:Sulfate transporter n=1 Tax=Mytilinidion resinicola TaxID=574789 RepID=A0A6A6YU40_9PEZI|nr:uncharacterized protein BDZ99DRAFT_461158 [Mytilinidion resinicola]KAF2812476.1 hypothetical protein BDZ99DRAFT_461158 [Mytilinidion resinicola]